MKRIVTSVWPIQSGREVGRAEAARKTVAGVAAKSTGRAWRRHNSSLHPTRIIPVGRRKQIREEGLIGMGCLISRADMITSIGYAECRLACLDSGFRLTQRS